MGSSKSKSVATSSLDELVLKEKKKVEKIIAKKKRLEKLAKEEEKRKRKKLRKNNKKNKKSKNKEQTKKLQQQNVAAATNMAITFKDYERSVELKLQKQVAEGFTHFVLNQIILSVQFFGNYEQETATAIERILQQENEKNQNLDKHSIIFPNSLDDAVENRILFQTRHGPDKNYQSSLQIQKMYVIFENVEISKPNDANYDSILPICKVDMDSNMVGTSKKSRGYLRLRLRESRNQIVPIKLSTTSSIDSVENNVYNENRKTELKLTPEYETLKLENFRDSNSSGIDVESDYTYITSLNTHQPLKDLTKSQEQNYNPDTKALPECCITVVKYCVDGSDSEDGDNEDEDNTDDEDDDDDDDCDTDNTIQLKYLNSKSFLSYFASLLKDHLANDLNLNENEFNDATWKGASIFTRSYEIIPAIQVSCWPDCAFEWKHRNRTTRINPNNDQPMQWPTPKMIQEIQTFGCHVIPLGHAPKTHKNPYRELEWKIVFPKAERYLESNLTPTQVKVFMITKALIKTFLEPQEKKDTFMFTMDHLRMHLFWQCEENFGAWPEEFLGEVLLRFLRGFLECTRIKYLKDYFVSGRNLFESIPESILIRVHTTISNIIENPVIHIMMAYRNLEQVEEFFPKFNYQQLFKILKIDNPLNLNNKSLLMKVDNQNIEKITQIEEDNVEVKNEKLLNFKSNLEDNNDDNIGLIGYSQKHNRTSIRRQSKKAKKRQRQQNVKRRTTMKPERRISIDSIDIEFILTKNLDEIERIHKKEIRQAFDDKRRTLIIEMFIKHFILLAKNYCQFQSLIYSRMYLNQANRLSKLLQTYGHDDAANRYITYIVKLRDNIETIRCNDDDFRPILPKRTSLGPVKSFQLHDVNTNTLNHMERQKSQDTNNIEHLRRKTVQFQEPTSFEPVSFNFESTTISRMNSKESNESEDGISKVILRLNSKEGKGKGNGGILKQISRESTKCENQYEIDETGKSYSEIFQLRKTAVHRSLTNSFILSDFDMNDNSSTDL